MERRALVPAEKHVTRGKVTRRHTHFVPNSKRNTGQRSKFDFSATPNIDLPRSKQKHANAPSGKAGAKPNIPIQDRRQQSTKLRIPLDMPQLPSRSRPPVTEPVLPRSPANSPLPVSYTKSWQESGVANAPSTIFEHGDDAQGLVPLAGVEMLAKPASPQADTHDKQPHRNRSLARIRFSRTRSSGTRTSTESSHAVSSDQYSQPNTQGSRPPRTKDNLQDSSKHGYSLHRRWSGTHWPMHGGFASTTPSPKEPPFLINRFLKPKHSESPVQSPEQNVESPKHKSYWRRKQSFFVRSEYTSSPPFSAPAAIHPAIATPKPGPGGEVKGQLADFFFVDVQENSGARPRAPNASKPPPISVWDSDALLMPLPSMTPPSTEEEESPMDSPIAEKPDFETRITTPKDEVHSPYPENPFPLSPEANALENWFRVPNPAGEEKRDENEMKRAEETQRLEWITPEHLPSSPLCPLHEKYIGEGKGFCVYHGRADGASPQTEASEDQMLGSVDAMTKAVMGNAGDVDRDRLVAGRVRRGSKARKGSTSFGMSGLELEGSLVKSRRTRADVVSSQ
ncbi:unnamed protein product [Periconia digitata]|uniref:Uncharacterized protein n=1 Tax=Periconia digitata TaxID=1303443 RepID=A0A9W4UNH4_9PLEO|nr:unnamed protein product [Periconia digitata]